MMIKYYVTNPVKVVTNALFLILWNCIASRITMERIASNSHSNTIRNVVMLELIFFFGSGNALIALQPFYQGILNSSWKCEVGDVKMGVWKYWCEYLKMVENKEVPRLS